MSTVFQFMTGILRLAITLGMLGGLVDATHEMFFQAGKARQKGLISLVSLNEQLVGHFPQRRK